MTFFLLLKEMLVKTTITKRLANWLAVIFRSQIITAVCAAKCAAAAVLLTLQSNHMSVIHVCAMNSNAAASPAQTYDGDIVCTSHFTQQTSN